MKFHENKPFYKEKKMKEYNNQEPSNTFSLFQEPETNEPEINEEIVHIE
jgi:hypothetical protein